MATEKLRADLTNKATIFPYISNPNLSLVQDPKSLHASKEIRRKFRRNSCLVTLAVATFDVTYSSVWKECFAGKPEPGPGEPYMMSLEEIVPFFRKHRLKLVAVDIFMRVIVIYDPKDENKEPTHRINPRILRVLVHQGHAYKINANLAEFDQVVSLYYKRAQLRPLSTRYMIREAFDYKEDQLIHDFREIYKFIVQYKGKQEFVRIICDNTIEEGVQYFRKEHGIVGSQLTVNCNTVSGFQIEQEGTIFRICNMKVRDVDSFCTMDNKEHYAQFMDQYASFYKALINKNHKSTYHPQFLTVLHEYIRSPLKGRFKTPDSSHPISSIDEVKAYTKRIMQMKYLPVFDEFSFFRPFNKKLKIEDYSIYLVQSPAKLQKRRDFIIFDRQYVLLSGFTLKESEIARQCTILYVATPCQLLPNEMTEGIQSVWESNLSNCDKKFISNMCFGWTDKKYNNRIRTEFFDSQQEADANMVDKPNSSVYNFTMNTGENKNKTKLYLVVDKRKQLMTEGFLPISFIKYDLQRLSMWNMYKSLQQGGLSIVGINTDCLYIQGDIVDFVEKNRSKFHHSKTFASIGKWTAKLDDHCPTKHLEVTQNELIIQPVQEIENTTTILDEEKQWDQPNNIMSKSNTRISADDPGSGKTHTAQAFVKRRNYILVVPFNTHRQELEQQGWNVVTLNKLLGLGVDDRHKGTAHDVTEIKVIIFDEIFMLSRACLRFVYAFMVKHPDIRYIVTGDWYQNPPIEKVDHFNKSTCNRNNERIIQFLFPSELKLTVIKRLNNERERKIYPAIRYDIFTAMLPIPEVVEKYKEAFGSLIHIS